MRILRVLTRPNVGGPTRQVAAFYREHQRLGHSTLLAVGRCGAEETAFAAEQLGVPSISFDEALARGPAAAGLVVIDDLGRGLAPFADRRAAAALLQLTRSLQPDVVHTHTSKAGVLGRRAAWAAGVPVTAHTFHGHVLRDYYGPLRSWLLARIERSLACRTTLLFAVSTSCADELATLGVAPRERLLVLPPAVDVTLAAATARAAARRTLGVSDDQLLVACAGRLVTIKRVDLFLAALAHLPDVRGAVFGDGPLREPLANSAGPRITFHGARPDLRELLPAFDALVIPSRREGCPLVAIEAFAAGVPVVGFDVPGVRDVVRDWGAGELVTEGQEPAGQAKLLATALHRLLTDPVRRANLVAAGHAALTRFAPASVAAALAAHYAMASRSARI